MLEVFFAITGLAFAGFLGYKVFQRRTARKALIDRDAALFAEIKPVADLVEKGQDPDPALLLELTRNSALRSILFAVLKVNKKEHLFPQEYLNFESGAETALVYWLLHPNELGQKPDEIRFVQKVSRQYPRKEETGGLDYYVFKFRMKPPHFAAEYGWILGVAGPYVAESEPYDSAPGTYSRYTSPKDQSPEALVQEVHNLAVGKGLY